MIRVFFTKQQCAVYKRTASHYRKQGSWRRRFTERPVVFSVFSTEIHSIFIYMSNNPRISSSSSRKKIMHSITAIVFSLYKLVSWRSCIIMTSVKERERYAHYYRLNDTKIQINWTRTSTQKKENHHRDGDFVDLDGDGDDDDDVIWELYKYFYVFILQVSHSLALIPIDCKFGSESLIQFFCQYGSLFTEEWTNVQISTIHHRTDIVIIIITVIIAIRFFFAIGWTYEWMNENICIFQLLVKLSKITYSKFIWCDWMIAWCCPLVFIRSKVVITFSLHCSSHTRHSHPDSWKSNIK